jgi:hypothetical protein
MTGRRKQPLASGRWWWLLVPLSAWAQSSPPSAPPRIDVNTRTPIVAPLPQPRSPVRSDSASKAARLGQELDDASRRVQSDSIGNDVKRRDALLENDRARTEQQRASATAAGKPLEAERLRNEYDQRRAEHEQWRDEQQRKRDALDAPPPASGDH